MRDRLVQRLSEYLPPPDLWWPAAVPLVLFLLIVFAASARRWHRPVLRSFGMSTLVVASFGTADALWFHAGARQDADVAPWFAIVGVWLMIAVSFLGPIALVFSLLRRRAWPVVLLGTCFVAALAYPFVFLLMLEAACMEGSGCV